MALRDWTERHRGFWEFIKFNVLSNVSTIVRFALMWAGYVLGERVVEVVRHGPLSEPGASLDAPEAPDEPKATEPCADGSRYLWSSLHRGRLGGGYVGCCFGKDANLAAAPLVRDPRESQQCTQMTQNSPERPFSPICVHSCVPQASCVTGRGHGSHDVDGSMAPVTPGCSGLTLTPPGR